MTSIGTAARATRRAVRDLTRTSPAPDAQPAVRPPARAGRGPATPAAVHERWGQGINDGNLDALLALYEPDAAFAAEPGTAVHGTAAIRAVLAGFLALHGTVEVTPRRVIPGTPRIGGTLALVVSDWTLTGTDALGQPVQLGGTTADVVRQRADGTWRIALDNPHGTT